MYYLRSILSLLMLFSVAIIHAQQEYTVDGTTYTLKTEISGKLSLLWNTIDGDYRYFSQKGTEIVELTNTKQDKEYLEEYKEVLAQQTSDAPVATDKLKLTLTSLRNFFVEYNKKVDPNFVYVPITFKIKTRLGVFAGVSNNAYFYNPDNSLLPVLGIDFELVDEVQLKRHAVVFQFRQLLASSDYDFSSSQLSFNYRFKYVKTAKFDAFINLKIATYTWVSRDEVITDIEGNDVIAFGSGNEFQAPAAFGLGFDYALGNGYLSFAYNDIFAVAWENNGNFPMELTLGYKFNL